MMDPYAQQWVHCRKRSSVLVLGEIKQKTEVSDILLPFSCFVVIHEYDQIIFSQWMNEWTNV